MVPWSELCYRLPDTTPKAHAILVLSGGLLDRIPPRQTIEVDDAGDRVLYAAHLFKQQKAGLVICTGGVEWTTGPRDHRTTGPQDHGTTRVGRGNGIRGIREIRG